MCGIAGFVLRDASGPLPADVLRTMSTVLAHRGPDDCGTWSDASCGLVSRRLAVIDLSPRGHMPMSNEDGSLHIVFNGEIYNFLELRKLIESRGHILQSHTDTEVVLHLYEDEGPRCLDRLRGMFAFAIWNSRERSLFIARDRLGKKPLHYFHGHDSFVFGSEVKAVLQHPEVRRVPHHRALHEYLTLGYVPSPASAFEGIRKLPPAHYLLLHDNQLKIQRYWSLSYRDQFQDREAELKERLTDLLRESVRLRMISDVPIGALLSGGVDSATVVALMRQLTNGTIRTFSIGFDQKEYDELAYAKEVATHLHTEHYEEVVRPSAADLVPKLVWHYDEPFADSSAVPSFVVSQLARKTVTVALTGDGGDESFLGYDRYLAAAATGRIRALPQWSRAVLARILTQFPAGAPKSVTYRLRRLAAVIDLAPRQQYERWMTIPDDTEQREPLFTPDFLCGRATYALDVLERAFDASDAPTFVEAAAHTDIQTYLPDDLLVKMDIASMAQSLEVRSPLLDHEVVEFVARIPAGMKLRGTVQKSILKSAMKDFLPARVLTRRKMGFGVPIDRWLRDDLYDFVHDLLMSSRSLDRGYFNSRAIQSLLEEHRTGIRHHHTRLWSLMMLELWHRMFIDNAPPLTPPSSL